MVGGKQFSQCRIFDRLECLSPDVFADLKELGFEIRECSLHDIEYLLPTFGHELGLIAEGCFLLVGERCVRLRQHPVGCALKDMKLFSLGRDFGHELHSACGATNHRDALSAQVMVMIPMQRVKQGPFEGVEPWDVRRDRGAKHANGADHELRLDFFTTVENESPAGARFVPLSRDDAGSKTQIRFEAVVEGCLLKIRPDLRL